MPATLPPQPPVEPGYAEVRRLDLKTPFHTLSPWSVYVLAPTGPNTGSGAQTGAAPVKVCFTGGSAAKTECTAITSGLDDDRLVYAYQTLGGVGAIGAAPDPDGLKIEALAPGIEGVVVTATYSGGGPGALTQRLVWTYRPSDDRFTRAAALKFESGLGEDRAFADGPMAGYYLTAEATWGAGETRWDPHRFTLDAYKLSKTGRYLRVLSYVTTRKYPAERQTQDYVIDRELSQVKQLLRTVYPQGSSF